jgi:hypothetical protein
LNKPYDPLPDLPDLQSWRRANNNPAISLLDYVGFVGTMDSMASHAALFDPDLVDFEGARFLAHRFSVEGAEQWRAQGLSLPDIQRVMNHVHVSTLLQSGASDEASDWFAERLASIWRKTIVGANVEVSGRGYHEATVTFSEKTTG